MVSTPFHHPCHCALSGDDYQHILFGQGYLGIWQDHRPLPRFAHSNNRDTKTARELQLAEGVTDEGQW
jgi:hypothetical protein